VRSARARNAALTGPDGLLRALTKPVFETGLAEEMTDHLGYDKHAPAGRGTRELRQRHRNQDAADGIATVFLDGRTTIGGWRTDRYPGHGVPTQALNLGTRDDAVARVTPEPSPPRPPAWVRPGTDLSG